MAFLLRNSAFIHTPKTGGQWVVAALANAGVTVDRVGAVHTTPDEVEGALADRRIVFTTVRHPLSWYSSMWAHRMDEQWGPINDPEWFTPRWVEFWAEFTGRCRAESFSEFVEKCVAFYPDGFVSALYDAYTRGCNRIARYERLTEDVFGILVEAGETFDATRLSRTQSRNVRGQSQRWRRRLTVTPEVERMVLDTEREAIRRFYSV